MDWNDGTPPEALKSSAIPNSVGTTPGVSYALYAQAHKFKTAGKYNVTLHIYQHCRTDEPGTDDFTFSFPIDVYGRIPIQSAVSNTPNLQKGKAPNIHIVLTAPAPRCNARVTIDAPKRVFSNPPAFVEIPSNGTEGDIVFKTRPDAPSGIAVVTVWTVSTEKKAIKIRIP